MLAAMNQLDILAQQLCTHVEKVESFAAAADSPPEVQAARREILKLTHQIQVLVQGPSDFLNNHQVQVGTQSPPLQRNSVY